MKARLAAGIKELESLIQEYGSFMVIANSFAKNQIAMASEEQSLNQPALPEYVAAICLKYPFSLGHREFSASRTVAEDLQKINQLASGVISQYSFIHHSKYNTRNPDGSVEPGIQIAQLMSSYELTVRNPTFESFHFDILNGLYEKYEDYFKSLIGVSVSEAVNICLTIGDYIESQFTMAMTRCRNAIKEHYEEIIAYKRRGTIPKNFYPPEMLAEYKNMQDHHIRMNFEQSMQTYEMVMMGETLSFSAKSIAAIENIDVEKVQKFLDILSLEFGIGGETIGPEIMSPLKDRPLVKHTDRYIVPSVALLDYSLDRLFQKYLLKDAKARDKYKQHRHDFLLDKGMEYLVEVLKDAVYYKNLTYENGELDGLIIYDNYVFLIEAKGHIISDRAKSGYIDRVKKDIKEVITGSYNQAIRSFNLLYGKQDVVFKNKKGEKIIIDGTRFQNAFFISLMLEDFSAFSCNLKVNNPLGLFTKETFPWIVSLYDLRAVCEHMEGPSYFIHYLHRRKVFFSFEKFMISDEIDILGYYLTRNLWFGDMIESTYERSNVIFLESMADAFDKYYAYKDGRVSRFYPKMKHYSVQPIKNLVKALEDSSLSFSKDAAVQILEFGTKTKKDLIEKINLIKKKFSKDKKNHDFRLTGSDYNGKSWMLSYWVAPLEDGMLEFFENFVNQKYKEYPVDRYVAILDSGIKDYRFVKVINKQKKITYV